METGKNTFTIHTIDADNVDEMGFFCVNNRRHPGYISKRAWLQNRFKEGLRIKQVRAGNGKPAGFLEYIPGEYSWRVVKAEGYLVIHCLWVSSAKFGIKGMASALLQECIEDARLQNRYGVAVVSSSGPWMASKEIFLQNGFIQADEAPSGFQLLVYRSGRGPLPAFPTSWQERMNAFKGLTLLFTGQCPYIGKAIAELPPVAERFGTELSLVSIGSAAEARAKMASPYGMFNLIYNGRLLADHPISATRFRNIL
ncbi:MAG: GNAT family N-acetyltransferase, partial [Calditrichia bacterium]